MRPAGNSSRPQILDDDGSPSLQRNGGGISSHLQRLICQRLHSRNEEKRDRVCSSDLLTAPSAPPPTLRPQRSASKKVFYRTNIHADAPARRLNCCFISFCSFLCRWRFWGVGWRWRFCRVFIYPGKSNRWRSAVGEVRGSMEGLKKPWCKIDVPHMLLMAARPQRRRTPQKHLFVVGK